MKRTILLVAMTLFATAALGHRMNETGRSLDLHSSSEDAANDKDERWRDAVDQLDLSLDDKLRFSVILRPQSGKNWSPGHDISACFYADTSDAFRAAFEAVANEWFENISLRLVTRTRDGDFSVCEMGRFEVRISSVAGVGSASIVGKTRSASAYKPDGTRNETLNIDFPGTEGPLFRFLVLHEAGHMLGVEHEHQNGNSRCRFKESAVYARYAPLMPGDTPEERTKAVKTNIIDRYYAGPSYYVTEFDKDSAMIYFFEASMYEDDVASECQGGQPDRLSSQDLAGIEALYGRRSAGVAAADPLADLKILATSLATSRLPDVVQAEILATALRAHPATATIAPK